MGRSRDSQSQVGGLKILITFSVSWAPTMPQHKLMFKNALRRAVSASLGLWLSPRASKNRGLSPRISVLKGKSWGDISLLSCLVMKPFLALQWKKRQIWMRRYRVLGQEIHFMEWSKTPVSQPWKAQALKGIAWVYHRKGRQEQFVPGGVSHCHTQPSGGRCPSLDSFFPEMITFASYGKLGKSLEDCGFLSLRISEARRCWRVGLVPGKGPEQLHGLGANILSHGEHILFQLFHIVLRYGRIETTPNKCFYL